MMTIRLDYAPHLELGGFHLDRFSVTLDGEVVVRATRLPLYAGARELLRRGHDPAQLMTIRLAGRDHDSFDPAPIGELAKWTIEETERGGLHRRKWRPFIGYSVKDEQVGDDQGDFAAMTEPDALLEPMAAA